MFQRSSPFRVRHEKQTGLRLPILPTTTIGSFPQTTEVRRARATYRSGKMARSEYEALMHAEIENAIRFQEEIGPDVLVHGEFERNDMVEYFGEQLHGFAFYRERLGAELWLPLREAPVAVRGCVTDKPYDDDLGALRAVFDRTSGQGYVDWAGDPARMVVCPRRSAEIRSRLLTRIGPARRSGGPGRPGNAHHSSG